MKTRIPKELMVTGYDGARDNIYVGEISISTHRMSSSGSANNVPEEWSDDDKRVNEERIKAEFEVKYRLSSEEVNNLSFKYKVTDWYQLPHIYEA